MFDFTIELRRTNELLERIATAIERVAGPEQMAEQDSPLPELRKTTGADIGRVDMTGEKKVTRHLRSFLQE